MLFAGLVSDGLTTILDEVTGFLHDYRLEILQLLVMVLPLRISVSKLVFIKVLGGIDSSF